MSTVCPGALSLLIINVYSLKGQLNNSDFTSTKGPIHLVQMNTHTHTHNVGVHLRRITGPDGLWMNNATPADGHSAIRFSH